MGKHPAGFVFRALADLLDFFILVIPIALLFYLISGDYSYKWTMGWIWNGVYVLYLTVVPLFWDGYIIGKRIFKIKVKRVDEKELTFKNMFLREVVGKFLIVYLTFGLSNVVSVFMILFRSDKRAIHDLLSGTYVSND